MKNFKKVLALVLAVATLLSFATVASAADFKDASSIDHTEAVDVLSAIGVLEGYTDGEFKPTKVITRAEAAKIIAMFDNGDTDIDELYAPVDFTDVESGHWAESFISYCYHTGIIAGVGNNKYAPSDDVTGVQFLKMVLVVLGFDAKEEGLTGTGYAVRTRALARELGLLAGIGNDFDYTKGLTRENAAQIMLNALTVGTVEYGKKIIYSAGSKYIGISDSEAHVNSEETLAKAWNLYHVSGEDAFGRPTWTWRIYTKKYPNSAAQYTTIGTYFNAPVATYTTAVTGCDLFDDLDVELKKDYEPQYEEWTDGKKTATGELKDLEDKSSVVIGAQGQLTEVYEMIDDDDPTYRVVHINTYLAKVTKVNAEVKDSKGHLKSARSVDMMVYCRTPGNANYNSGAVGDKKDYGYLTSASFTTEDFAAGDYLLVQGVVDTTKTTQINVVNAEVAESKTQKVTSIARLDKKNTVGLDGEDVKVACKFAYDSDFDTADVGTQKVVFFDTYGNVIGKEDPAEAAASYAVLDKMYIEYAKGDATVYASLILFDGESTKKDVTVGKIKYGTETMTAWKWIAESDEMTTNDYQFQWAGSTWYTEYFYQKVVNYVENEDGTTDFQINAAKNLNTDDIKIVKGKKYVYASENGILPVLKTSENTIYMVQTSAAPNAKYASYVGYENVPSMTTTAAAQYVLASDGTVKLIYIYNPVLPTSSEMVYYAGDNKADRYDGKYTFSVYAIGEDGKVAAKDIVTKNADLFNGKGFYTLTTNSDGVVEKAKKGASLTVTLHKLVDTYVYAINDSDVFTYDEYGNVTGIKDNKDSKVGKIEDVSAVEFYNLSGNTALTINTLDNVVVDLWRDAAGNTIAIVVNPS